MLRGYLMKNNSGKIRKTAKLIFIVGCVYAVITFISFITTISSYLSQGYPLFEVFKYLFASQLLPTVVQPFVLISGIAYIASCVADLFEPVPLMVPFIRDLNTNVSH